MELPAVTSAVSWVVCGAHPAHQVRDALEELIVRIGKLRKGRISADEVWTQGSSAPLFSVRARSEPWRRVACVGEDGGM